MKTYTTNHESIRGYRLLVSQCLSNCFITYVNLSLFICSDAQRFEPNHIKPHSQNSWFWPNMYHETLMAGLVNYFVHCVTYVV